MPANPNSVPFIQYPHVPGKHSHPYEYQEYPKRIGEVRIMDEEEERAYWASQPKTEMPTELVEKNDLINLVEGGIPAVAEPVLTPAPVPPVLDEKQQLIDYCASARIPIDKRWGLGKIKEAITKHTGT